MNSKIFTAFGLGTLVASISLGAIQLVSAANDATITACASKSTGGMRYITKGSCKKTETKLSWNQQGPQGFPGAKGDSGAKGETGASGSKGETGTNGQNLYAVDATGKTLGVVTSSSGLNLIFQRDNYLWFIYSNISNGYDNTGTYINYWQDSSCSKPFITASRGMISNPQLISVDNGFNMEPNPSAKAYRDSGDPLAFTGREVFSNVGGVCTSLSSGQKSSLDASGEHIYTAVEVPKQTYTAPVSIVQK